MSRLRLGILGSTRGTDMQAIIDAIAHGQLLASLVCVISNKEDAFILERARAHNITAIFLDPKGRSRTEYDDCLSNELRRHDVDLVVLIGYMRILSADFIAQWRDRIINVHPSLLPAFAGGMNHDVHAAVIQSGMSETGCTVHQVTELVDQGRILMQKRCPVLACDTVATLKARVQELESLALLEVIAAYGVHSGWFID